MLDTRERLRAFGFVCLLPWQRGLLPLFLSLLPRIHRSALQRTSLGTCPINVSQLFRMIDDSNHFPSPAVGESSNTGVVVSQYVSISALISAPFVSRTSDELLPRFLD